MRLTRLKDNELKHSYKDIIFINIYFNSKLLEFQGIIVRLKKTDVHHLLREILNFYCRPP